MWGHKTSHFLFLIYKQKQYYIDMKNLTDFIVESKTTPKQMKEYEISWLKFVQNEKEMKEAIDAIKEGFLAAYEYRTDPQYESDMNKKYVAATKLLKEFIDNLEIKSE